jgi:microcin C transport system substrate-binding protein
VVAEDPLQVLFKFNTNNRSELPLILGQLPVLPKHWWATATLPGNLMLGSGPYKVAEVKAGRSMRYERVKDYWAKDLPAKGFHTITITDYYRDNTVALKRSRPGSSITGWRSARRTGPTPTTFRR